MEVRYYEMSKRDLSVMGGRNTRNRKYGESGNPDSPVGDLFFRYDFSNFLTTALPGKRLLDPFLLARRQIKGMFLHFLDDVFLLNLSLETPQRILNRFTVL